MHRPALNLLPPTHTILGGEDRRKDLGHLPTRPLFRPGYLEAPVRNGLRTPPADEMGSTTYQPQYQGFLARQEPQYTGSTSSYRSSINSTAATYDHLSRPASTASYRDTAPPVSGYHPEPHSPHLPVRSTHDVVPYGEKSPQNMSPKSDLITPNLQIPSSINNSGGSLAEFAAQVSTRCGHAAPERQI